jgi:hypothetical protein
MRRQDRGLNGPTALHSWGEGGNGRSPTQAGNYYRPKEHLTQGRDAKK